MLQWNHKARGGGNLKHSPLTPEEISRSIYEEARARFLTDGIAATEMKKIAAHIGIGRSTLYRYYPSKEGLAVHVAFELIEQLLFADLVTQIDPALDGYGKTCAFYQLYTARLCERPDVLRFFLEYDSMFSIGGAVIPMRLEYEARMGADIEAIAAFVREGQLDASVRTDLDPVVFTMMCVNACVGLSQRCLTHALRSDERYKVEADALLDMQRDFILCALKS